MVFAGLVASVLGMILAGIAPNIGYISHLLDNHTGLEDGRILIIMVHHPIISGGVRFPLDAVLGIEPMPVAESAILPPTAVSTQILAGLQPLGCTFIKHRCSPPSRILYCLLSPGTNGPHP